MPPSASKNLEAARALSKEINLITEKCKLATLFFDDGTPTLFVMKTNEYIECLAKWESDGGQFFCDNIEFSLGQGPGNTHLWKIYLNYLKTKNDTRILDAFSRFCRIFIEDSKTRNEYRNEIERIGKLLSIDVTKWWIDSIEFERIFGNLRSTRLLLQIALKNCETDQMFMYAIDFEKQYGSQEAANLYVSQFVKKVLNHPIKEAELGTFQSTVNFRGETDNNDSVVDADRGETAVTGFTRGLRKQYIPLPLPLINYIFDFGSPELRHRFYESCKYFFIKGGMKPICHQLTINSTTTSKFFSQSLEIGVGEISTKLKKNMIISNMLHVCKGFETVSILLQRIQIKVKTLHICDQYLTCAELKLLESPRLELVSMGWVTITDFDKSPIEKILEIFANVPSLE